MKYFTILSLLFGAIAIGGADTETRELHRGGGGGRHHGGGRGGHHGGGDHHGGYKNHTHGNMTDWLNQTCTANNITCLEVTDEFLANCTYHHHDHDSSEDTDRELLAVFEEDSMFGEDKDLVELYDMFEDVDDDEDALDEELLSTELSGTERDRGLLKKRRRHHGGDDNERHHGPKSGKWGNLTDAEMEAMKIKRLTCRCCGNHTSG